MGAKADVSLFSPKRRDGGGKSFDQTFFNQKKVLVKGVTNDYVVNVETLPVFSAVRLLPTTPEHEQTIQLNINPIHSRCHPANSQTNWEKQDGYTRT
jgi:hypothetical protein